MRKLRLTPVFQVKNSQQAELIQKYKILFGLFIIYRYVLCILLVLIFIQEKRIEKETHGNAKRKKRKRILPTFHIFCLVSTYRGEIFIDINTRVPEFLYWTKNIKNLLPLHNDSSFLVTKRYCSLILMQRYNLWYRRRQRAHSLFIWQ